MPLISSFYIHEKSEKKSGTIYDNETSDRTEFLIGAMDNYYSDYHLLRDSMNMNLWHRYTGDSVIDGKHLPRGLSFGDLINVSSDVYKSDIERQLTSNQENGFKSWLQRPKIEWLCYGQRSDYQCERDIETDDNLWFYSFGAHYTGSDITDEGVKVVQCIAGRDKAGWVARKLKANNEQCSKNEGENAWMDDSQCGWIVKPRIRLDPAFVNNPANRNVPVCSLSIVNDRGEVIKNVILKAKNFLIDNVYDGKYIEEFRYYEGDDSLFISGAWGDSGPWSSRGNDTTDAVIPNVCKADIQLYWYGNCNFRVDYIRVDNTAADELFRGRRDKWIEEESQLAKFNSSAVKFYIELFKFNNIPCIKYVNDKLKTINSNTDIITDFFWAYYTAHIPWSLAIHGKWSTSTHFDADNIIKNYIFPVGITEFLIETYPLTGSERFPLDSNFSKIPNTLPIISGPGIIAYPVEPEEYDNWLQDQLDYSVYPNPPSSGGSSSEAQWRDPGYFRWTLKLASEISQKTGINWINIPQAHLWWKPPFEVRREPTNEELELMANLALSYGAKGLMYFYWNGFGNIDQGNFYGRGFCEDYSGTPRYLNAYGEPKWNKLKEILQRVKKIGPEFMSFDNKYTRSYSYYIEEDRAKLINNTFLKKITTHLTFKDKPGILSPVAEHDSSSYTQVSVFRSSDETPAAYFMITNRRCSPIQANFNDGRRYISVVVDAGPAYFQGSTKWKVVNALDESVAGVFEGGSIALIDLGWYNPGEGKLYKIIPADK
ncbi:MAG: hypothetical protein IAE90_01995 [Ignavibacteria bacterium]|nr:hypothetical protein [Ignavibacteria bacterium]